MALLKSIFLITMTITLSTADVFCQSITPQLISSSAIEYQDPNLIFSSSIGEVLINDFEIEEQFLTQGFHQPEVIITSVGEIAEQDLDFSVYPNPTAESIQIKCMHDDLLAGHLLLINNQGQIIFETKLEHTNEHEISLSHLPEGVYYLSLKDNNHKIIRTYQIQKITK